MERPKRSNVQGPPVTPTAARVAPEAARHAGEDDWRGLKIGVHSYSMRERTLDEALAMTERLGVRYVSLNPRHLPLESTREQITTTRRKIAERGLVLMAAGVFDLNADERSCRAVFEYAKALGVMVVIANPALDCYEMLDRLVEEYDIFVAVHNHGPEGLYKTPTDVLRAIEKHDQRIGASVDLGHYERAGIRAGDAIRALRGRIYDVHLKDVDRVGAEGRSVAVGSGVVDFQDVFRLLLAMKFPYHVALEHDRDSADPLPAMEKSLKFVRNLLARMQ